MPAAWLLRKSLLQGSIVQVLERDDSQIRRLISSSEAELRGRSSGAEPSVTPLDTCQLMETMHENHSSHLVPQVEHYREMFEHFYRRCLADKVRLSSVNLLCLSSHNSLECLKTALVSAAPAMSACDVTKPLRRPYLPAGEILLWPRQHIHLVGFKPEDQWVCSQSLQLGEIGAFLAAQKQPLWLTEALAAGADDSRRGSAAEAHQRPADAHSGSKGQACHLQGGRCQGRRNGRATAFSAPHPRRLSPLSR